MKNRLPYLLSLVFTLSSSCSLLYGQQLTPHQKEKIDAALPNEAPATPKKPRRMLVTNLAMRDGQPSRGSSYAAIPVHNYAIRKMGELTGAYTAVFDNDIEQFRPDYINQFDAVCFLNSVGVLFEDPELRQSLLDYVAEGNGIVGIHDAIATFVQYPVYDQWPAFGQMLGGTENGGHPWNGEVMTIKIEDTDSPLTAMFSGESFQIADQAFQLQEPTFRDRLHVLMSIDVEKTGLIPGRRILPVRSEDLDFPMSWTRPHEKGRIFYSGLGHNAHIFWHPVLLKHMLAGMNIFTLGLPPRGKPSTSATAEDRSGVSRQSNLSGFGA